MKASLLHELKTSLPHPLTWYVYCELNSCFVCRSSFMPSEAMSPILPIKDPRNKGRFHDIFFDHLQMAYKIRIKYKNPAYER